MPNITPFYKLQSPALGETVSPSMELLDSLTMENQIFGAIRVHSGGDGIIRGCAASTMFLFNPGTGTYTISSIENKATGIPAIEAFINQVYVYQDNALSWTGLANNTTYYLYIELVENPSTGQSSLVNKQVTTGANTTGIIPSDALLVAIAVINEPGNSFISANPPGRITIPVLGDHIVNNQNPHTPYLYQSNLAVSGLSVLSTLQYRQLLVDNLIISGNALISGTVTVLGPLILSGGLIINGNVIYQNLQIQNLLVPGTLTLGNLIVSSGLDVYSTSTFRQNIVLTSGVTIDGLDPSVAIPLIDGSNADILHTHILGSLPLGSKPLYFSPNYPSTVVSGLNGPTISGSFLAVRAFNNNYYQFLSNQTGQFLSGVSVTPVTRMILPPDFQSIDRIEINTGVGANGLLSGNNVTLYVFDKDFNPVTINESNGVAANAQISKSTFTLSGVAGLQPYFPMTVMNRMCGYSGLATFLGDMLVWYVPVNGEKLVFDFNTSGVNLAAQKTFDGMRVAPNDLRVESYIVSQQIGLSGATVFGVNAGTIGATPTTLFTSTPKPTISVGANGLQWQTSTLIPSQNTLISKGQFITADLDLVASGSSAASLQMITHRL